MAAVLRRLRAIDVEEYRRIRLTALAEAPEAFGSLHADEAARPLDHFALRLDTSLVVGAYWDGLIVGMAGLRRQDGPKDRHKAMLWGVFVSAFARGRGVAAALVQAVIAEAPAGVEQVTLAVVSSNAAALRLYERAGYARYGLEPRALKRGDDYDDEVLMVRFLDRAAA